MSASRGVGLQPEHSTLPSLLRKAGYRTALIGKWHLGALPTYGPLKSGYDVFYGFRGGALDYFTHKSGLPDSDTHDLWDGDSRVEDVGYLTDMLGRRAVEVIDGYAKDRQPFFLSLHFNAPHWPWEGPEDREVSKRLAAMTHNDGGSLKTYAAMVTRMDFQIGRVLDALRRNDLQDNTIVVFTSDNGGERFSDNWPFSGRKGELLEGGLRIPAIIRWPGKISGGAVSEQTIMSMDWMPTLLAAAGVESSPDYPPDGIDLAPAMTAGFETVDRALFWRYKAYDQRAARIGDWKWLQINGNHFLFNLVEDQLERANLKDRQPQIYRRLVDAYDSWEADMLPINAASLSTGLSGARLADHYGNTTPPPMAKPGWRRETESGQN